MQNKGENPVLKSVLQVTQFCPLVTEGVGCMDNRNSQTRKQTGSSIRELLFGTVEFSCRRRGFSGVTVLIPALGILEIMECNHTLTPPPLASAGSTELAASCKMKENPWIIKCFQNGNIREMLWQNLVFSLFPSALFEDPPQRQ